VTTVVIDLSGGAEAIERAWRELSYRLASRQADPRLYDHLQRLSAEAGPAGRATEEQVAEIREALDRCHPAAVLAEWHRVLLEGRPALGAYRQERGQGQRRDEPNFEPVAVLKAALAEMLDEFGWGRAVVIATALQVADGLGIEEHVADKVIVEAVRRG
jgi:hypothetical protein